jgi:hypothetical protein
MVKRDLAPAQLSHREWLAEILKSRLKGLDCIVLEDMLLALLSGSLMGAEKVSTALHDPKVLWLAARHCGTRNSPYVVHICSVWKNINS